jgi:hypothetical protein
MSLYAHAIWAAIVFLALILGALYERHQGAQSCLAADAVAATKQQVKVAVGQASATAEVAKEMSDYAQATGQPVTTAPIVRVCPAAKPSRPGPVLPAAAPAGAAARAAELPAAPGPAAAGSDLGASLEAVGRDADAQVRGLIDYITQVCPPPQ